MLRVLVDFSPPNICTICKTAGVTVDTSAREGIIPELSRLGGMLDSVSPD
jgi:hypothetical protein